MSSYNDLRLSYLPEHIKVLFIAESPPPAADVQSSRHFYRSDKIRKNDRLFINTIKALYTDAADKTETQIEPEKEKWLRKLQTDGYFMIEALTESQIHEITKDQRQERIRAALPDLLARVGELTSPDTQIILIKSNVFDVAAEPLRAAGFNVLNKELVDYPGRFNKRDYRDKLQKILKLTY